MPASSDKEISPESAKAPDADPRHDSPKRQGDKIASARDSGSPGAGPAPDKVGDPSHDSPKRQGDKLEKARDAASGKPRSG